MEDRGGSRISRRGRGHGPVLGLRCGCFLVKMYVKTKELGPVWGGVELENFVCRSANGRYMGHTDSNSGPAIPIGLC